MTRGPNAAQHPRMRERSPQPGATRPRATGAPPVKKTSEPAGLLGLQRTAGNAAVARLLGAHSVQRAPGSGEEPAGGGVGTTIPLGEAIEGHFVTAPFWPPSLVSLIDSADITERDNAFATASVRKAIIDHLGEEDRVAVFSALLAGRPYVPDFESTIFQTYSTTKADEVSTEVNRRFVEAVGISRALDWSSPVDKPLARYWLRLRDEVVRREIRTEEEQRFRDEVLAALATSTDEAVSVIESGLAEHVAVALGDQSFMRTLRDDAADFEAFARLAEALGRQPPVGFGLRDRSAVREAFADAWADSEPGPDGHEEGGWIYLDLVTGSISVERADAEASLSKRIQLGYPPTVDDAVLIGTFHTHPIPGPYQGFASDADEELARGWKVPSTIIPGEGRSKWFGVPVRKHLTGGQTFPTY